MTQYRIELAPEAEFDISQGFHWYRERNALAAEAFRSEVFEMIEVIGNAPLNLGADENHDRYRVLKRFPYTIWYSVHGDTVSVVAVAHHKRRPNYWRTKNP